MLSLGCTPDINVHISHDSYSTHESPHDGVVPQIALVMIQQPSSFDQLAHSPEASHDEWEQYAYRVGIVMTGLAVQDRSHFGTGGINLRLNILPEFLPFILDEIHLGKQA